MVELWPEARQVAAQLIVYEPRRSGQKTRAPQWHYYLIVGPPRSRPIKPARAAGLLRGHWGVENRLHHVLDRTYGEDARRSALGAAPMALGLSARVAIALVRDIEVPGRTNASMPEKRIHLAAHTDRIAAIIRRKT